MKPLFVFDLDSTITSCEILPLIARHAGMEAEMQRLTEAAMSGGIPFEQDFRRRVDLLRGVPLSHARNIASQAPLNEEIAGFIRQNPQRCIIMTGNLDVWIEPVIENLGMNGRCMCSHALTAGESLLGVACVLDKEKACRRLARPFVAVGDGSNDAGMLRAADLGIAFGGVRSPSAELIAAANMVVFEEKKLVEILQNLL